MKEKITKFATQFIEFIKKNIFTIVPLIPFVFIIISYLFYYYRESSFLSSYGIPPHLVELDSGLLQIYVAISVAYVLVIFGGLVCNLAIISVCIKVISYAFALLGDIISARKRAIYIFFMVIMIGYRMIPYEYILQQTYRLLNGSKDNVILRKMMLMLIFSGVMITGYAMVKVPAVYIAEQADRLLNALTPSAYYVNSNGEKCQLIRKYNNKIICRNMTSDKKEMKKSFQIIDIGNGKEINFLPAEE